MKMFLKFGKFLEKAEKIISAITRSVSKIFTYKLYLRFWKMYLQYCGKVFTYGEICSKNQENVYKIWENVTKYTLENFSITIL